MSRALRLLLPATAALLLLAPAALADEARPGQCYEAKPSAGTKHTYTCTQGPFDVAGYEVKQSITLPVVKPEVDGFITDMDVNLVNKDGSSVPINRLMLHHIVFGNLGPKIGSKHDGTCSTFSLWDPAQNIPAISDRFYGAGEERAQLHLPSGYGYKTAAADQWNIVWMFMNHRQTADRAYVQYHVTVDTAPDLTAVTPYWLDVRNCSADPVFDVPGGGKPGSTFKTSSTWTPPVSGRIVAGGGHVHGGAKNLVVSQPSCADRTIFRSDPAWGLASHPFYNVKPILHEPGPIAMSAFNTQQGIPVAAGEPLKLTASYDNRLPHTRVMGITLVYVAPDEAVTGTCGALPGDIAYAQTSRPHRTRTPKFVVPLTGLNAAGKAVTIQKPPGRIAKLPRGGTIAVGDLFFSKKNVWVPRGSTLNWKFTQGQLLHNVTVASGPRGFSSQNLNGGRSFTQKLNVPGTYRLFCALHPVAMTETVTVGR